MRCLDGMSGPAAPIKTFARFHAGFLSSEDFYRILSICSNMLIFLLIFIDFDDFHEFRGMGCLDGVSGPAALIETFARFQIGFLSSEDFDRIPSIFIDLY